MIVEILKKSTIFSILPERDLKNIASLFDTLEFKNNDYIFMEGDPSDFLYIAASGKVKILKHTAAGKDVILEIKFPGELFCCSAVLDGRPFPDTAQAMESVTVLRVSRKSLLKLVDENPDLKTEIARYSGEKLKDAHEMLKDIASEKVDKRIASLLLKLSEKVGIEEAGHTKIDIELTRQELADMVGTSVETCIRIISRFQKEGLLKSSENRILLKRAALKKYLET
jgi:CRP/FNR family transcriptional regulator